jgi:hypothetical protein
MSKDAWLDALGLETFSAISEQERVVP